MTIFKIMMLPGDGIGPEILAQVQRIMTCVERKYDVSFDQSVGLIGGCAYDVDGVPLSSVTLAQAKASDAIILGCVGGPQWDSNTHYSKRPEAGLLQLRKELNLYANLRPIVCFEALSGASSLKREIVAGLDLLFVRELAGGVYFGEPRGIEAIPGGGRVGINTHRYTDNEIKRIARFAFESARKRRGKVHSTEKANVMECGLLWREEVTKLHGDEYSDVALEHILADNCAMQLVKNPSQFDVILADNLFGDVLSDAAAMLTGSLGMLPSASLGSNGPGLYEPVHGSAPDIAGQGIANPIASILSFAMALRYSLNVESAAHSIETAVNKVLLDGFRTADLMSDGMTCVSTQAMGEQIVKAL